MLGGAHEFFSAKPVCTFEKPSGNASSWGSPSDRCPSAIAHRRPARCPNRWLARWAPSVPRSRIAPTASATGASQPASTTTASEPEPTVPSRRTLSATCSRTRSTAVTSPTGATHGVVRTSRWCLVELFDHVQARRTQTSIRTVRGPRPLLQGISRCLQCGHGLQADRRRGQTPGYRKRHAGRCDTDNTASVAAPIDGQIGAIVESIQLPTDRQERMAGLATGERPQVNATKLQEKRRRLVRAFGDGGHSDAEYESRLAEIDRSIAAATPVAPVAVEEVAVLLANGKLLWAAATPEERRTLIAPLIERAYIDLAQKAIGAITRCRRSPPCWNTRLSRAAAPRSSSLDRTTWNGSNVGVGGDGGELNSPSSQPAPGPTTCVVAL